MNNLIFYLYISSLYTFFNKLTSYDVVPIAHKSPNMKPPTIYMQVIYCNCVDYQSHFRIQQMLKEEEARVERMREEHKSKMSEKEKKFQALEEKRMSLLQRRQGEVGNIEILSLYSRREYLIYLRTKIQAFPV